VEDAEEETVEDAEEETAEAAVAIGRGWKGGAEVKPGRRGRDNKSGVASNHQHVPGKPCRTSHERVYMADGGCAGQCPTPAPRNYSDRSLDSSSSLPISLLWFSLQH
jgi:hypothetical protein